MAPKCPRLAEYLRQPMRLDFDSTSAYRPAGPPASESTSRYLPSFTPAQPAGSLGVPAVRCAGNWLLPSLNAPTSVPPAKPSVLSISVEAANRSASASVGGPATGAAWMAAPPWADVPVVMYCEPGMSSASSGATVPISTPASNVFPPSADVNTYVPCENPIGFGRPQQRVVVTYTTAPLRNTRGPWKSSLPPV